MSFVIEGRIDGTNKCIGFCCEPLKNRPCIKLEEFGNKTIDSFVQLRNEIINEGIYPKPNHRVTIDCLNCCHYMLNTWNSSDTINYINLSLYPSPCQCRCIYCDYNRDYELLSHEEVIESYRKIFDILDYAGKINLISPNATYQVSLGEITIHPFKEKIYEFVQHSNTIFFTNCFNYDEQIAKNISANISSSINFSIDAGTSETWHNVKGFDNFNIVNTNLKKYRANSNHSEQIHLNFKENLKKLKKKIYPLQ